MKYFIYIYLISLILASLGIAPLEAQTSTGIKHTIEEGETLYQISTRYYGKPSKWFFIFQNNQEILKSADNITAGTDIIIPRLIPRPKTLIIYANPWAYIYLDNYYIGETPLVLEGIKPGEHYVTFKHPSYKQRTYQVNVISEKSYLKTDFMEKIK